MKRKVRKLVIRGESQLDRIFREARDAVRQERGRSGEGARYGTEAHATRRAFDRAVGAEVELRMRKAGIPLEVGLATPASIAAQRATAGAPRPVQTSAPKPAKRTTMTKFQAALSAAAKRIAGYDELHKGSVVCLSRELTPGYLLVRVLVTRNGISRDRHQAAADFAHEPWAPQVRYLGSTGRGSHVENYFLFERPDPDAVARARRSHENPLAAIEAFRVASAQRDVKPQRKRRRKAGA